MDNHIYACCALHGGPQLSFALANTDNAHVRTEQTLIYKVTSGRAAAVPDTNSRVNTSGWISAKQGRAGWSDGRRLRSITGQEGGRSIDPAIPPSSSHSPPPPHA